MSSPGLVLSIFPGIDLLGMAFEEEGYTVVRGPDPLWGGDVRRFHPPAGVFEGIIGGPPCQVFSRMRHIQPLAGQKHGNLIPEFERVVREARPRWFLMENVREAPLPGVEGYAVRPLLLNNRWLGEEQNRVRRFSFGTPEGLTLSIEVAVFEAPVMLQAVTAAQAAREPVRLGGSGKQKKTWVPLTAVPAVSGHGPTPAQRDTIRLRATVPGAVGAGHTNFPDMPSYSIEHMCELQGLPRDFADELPFTAQGKRKVIGNGVPLPMGRAIARAVRRAMTTTTDEVSA